MDRIIVSGSGPDIGKTVVSAILVTLLQGDYWKPVQCGVADSETISQWIDQPIHPSIYSLKAHLSPHHAARLENRKINPACLIPPETNRPLIIETAGGILVPLTTDDLSIDRFLSWGGGWVIVSRHYVGSINHTLLTIEALKQRSANILGLIFNGENRDSEEAILNLSGLPMLGRLINVPCITSETIKQWANEWQYLLPTLTLT